MGKTQSKIARAANLAVSPIHFKRYLRFQAKMPVEQIALQDKVTPETVKDSIAAVDAYRQQFTIERMNEGVIQTTLNTRDKVETALSRALDAKVTIEGQNGQKRVEDDHTVQLEAVKVFKDLVASVQPKGGKGLHIQTTVGVQANSGGPRVQSSGFGFEERLTKIRAKIDEHNLLPGEVGTVIEPSELETDDETGDEVLVESPPA